MEAAPSEASHQKALFWCINPYICIIFLLPAAHTSVKPLLLSCLPLMCLLPVWSISLLNGVLVLCFPVDCVSLTVWLLVISVIAIVCEPEWECKCISSTLLVAILQGLYRFISLIPYCSCNLNEGCPKSFLEGAKNISDGLWANFNNTLKHIKIFFLNKVLFYCFKY